MVQVFFRQPVEPDTKNGPVKIRPQISIKNISGNIKAVFLKLDTRNVHHKSNKMTAVMPLP